MLLFDENDTSDWQHLIRGGACVRIEQQTAHSGNRHRSHAASTDITGVWRCQVEPKSDLYGDRTGKLMDPEGKRSTAD